MINNAEPQKVLCLYHFFDAGTEARRNLAHFLAFGLHDELDVHLLVSGAASPELLDIEGVTTHTFPNKNLDFGAIGGFFSLGDLDLEEYTAALIINSSARGPFCSPIQSKPWFTLLTDKLSTNVALVGATVSELPSGNIWSGGYEQVYGQKDHLTHVQTYCYAVSMAYLRALIEFDFFGSKTEKTKLEVIRDYEIRLSGLALEIGFSIDCLLPGYGPVSRQHSNTGNLWSQNGDPVVNGGYFGRTLHPFEVLFVKTNRGLYDPILLDSLATSMVLDGRGSEDTALASKYFDAVLSAVTKDVHQIQTRTDHMVL